MHISALITICLSEICYRITWIITVIESFASFLIFLKIFSTYWSVEFIKIRKLTHYTVHHLLGKWYYWRECEDHFLYNFYRCELEKLCINLEYPTMTLTTYTHTRVSECVSLENRTFDSTRLRSLIFGFPQSIVISELLYTQYHHSCTTYIKTNPLKHSTYFLFTNNQPSHVVKKCLKIIIRSHSPRNLNCHSFLTLDSV